MHTFARRCGFFYRHIARPVCFRFDSEPIHNAMIALGGALASIPGIPSCGARLFRPPDPRLNTELAGMHLENPIGLAAGFDHEGKIARLLPALGFGFGSVGTLTHGAYAGNPYPRLKRAEHSRSILVNKGFKSRGMRETLAHISQKPFTIPTGLSIGQTNRAYRNHDEAIEDIEAGFREAFESRIPFAYFELNISCPNLNTPVSFSSPEHLGTLLCRIHALGLERPLFLKMPISLSEGETLALVDVAREHDVAAIIIGNLQHNRNDPAIDPRESAAFKDYRGNWSGAPCKRRSDELIARIFKHTGSLPIIGCGGVFSAEDAYQKIRLGASAIQLATALIFEGPLIAAEINAGLAQLLERDGFKRVEDAVGTSA